MLKFTTREGKNFHIAVNTMAADALSPCITTDVMGMQDVRATATMVICWEYFSFSTTRVKLDYNASYKLRLYTYSLGFYSLRRHHLIGIGIPIINLRWSSDHLRFIMEISIPLRWHLFIEQRLWDIYFFSTVSPCIGKESNTAYLWSLPEFPGEPTKNMEIFPTNSCLIAKSPSKFLLQHDNTDTVTTIIH